MATSIYCRKSEDITDRGNRPKFSLYACRIKKTGRQNRNNTFF
jgi:hypothetical protein